MNTGGGGQGRQANAEVLLAKGACGKSRQHLGFGKLEQRGRGTFAEYVDASGEVRVGRGDEVGGGGSGFGQLLGKSDTHGV